MSKALTVHVKEAFFVPISQLTEDEVQQAIQGGTFQFFKDSQCERCEFYQDSPDAIHSRVHWEALALSNSCSQVFD